MSPLFGGHTVGYMLSLFDNQQMTPSLIISSPQKRGQDQGSAFQSPLGLPWKLQEAMGQAVGRQFILFLSTQFTLHHRWLGVDGWLRGGFYCVVNAHVVERMVYASGLFLLSLTVQKEFLSNVAQLVSAIYQGPLRDRQSQKSGSDRDLGCPGPHHWHLLKLAALKHSLNKWSKQ